jgi:hypothetical protein
VRRISSGWTFFYKRVLPAIWFGFLILFVGISVFAGQRSSNFFPLVIVPVVMIGFGYFIMKKLVLDLVDEVWVDGDTLIVKNKGEEQRIAFTNVKNVNYSPYVNPPRVTVSLRHPTKFGDRVTFCAPVRFVPFSSSPMIADLIDRIDKAREQRA